MADKTTEPTALQKHAGNYAKGHTHALGMRISVENPAGSVRRGTAPDGTEWATELKHDYGYIRGTRGADKDHIDVFLGPDHKNSELPVHVVDQVDPDTGDFDEHKVMLGFKSPEEAAEAYHANYEPGWRGFGEVTALPASVFKRWAFGGEHDKSKPVSELDLGAEEPKGYMQGGVVDNNPSFVSPNPDYGSLEQAQNLDNTNLGFAGGGAVTGFFPHLNRRRPQNNDAERAKDDPVRAARGVLAGTLGLPGDIEGLARMLYNTGALSPVHAMLQATRVLPKVDDTPALPTSDFYLDALPNPAPGRDAVGALGALAGMDPFAVSRMARPAARAVGAAGKAVGKEALRQVARGVEGEGALAQALAPVRPMYAVKPKGGNWAPDPGLGGDTRVDSYAEDISPNVSVESNWLQNNIRKYIKNYLGTAEDPLLKLEAEGRLHLAPDQLEHLSRTQGWNSRPLPVGENGRRVYPGDSRHFELTGRRNRTQWENLADGQVYEMPAEDARLDYNLKLEELNDLDAPGMPNWLNTLPNNAPVYNYYNPMEDALGFGHVRDYLNEAVDAFERKQGYSSMDPAHLRQNMPGDLVSLIERGLDIDPGKLNRMSFPDIVAKTGDWNKMLMEAKRMEDLNKGLKGVLKQYDTGHQWVELGPDALKGEGDYMGHCVGGYCSSVESGAKRILSLRDKEGKPVTTVELARNAGKPMQWDDWWFRNHQRAGTEFERRAIRDFKGDGSNRSFEDYVKNSPEYTAYLESQNSLPWDVRQIKGRFNGKVPSDATPHIRDLLENLGPWGRVSDLPYAGLERLDAGSQVHDMLKNAGHQRIPRYLTEEELQKLNTGWMPDPQGNEFPGFARGGWVKRFDEGGSTDDAPSGPDTSENGIDSGAVGAAIGIGGPDVSENSFDSGAMSAAMGNGPSGPGSPGFSVSPSTAATALGLVGAVTGNQNISNAAQGINAVNAAVNGNIAPAVGLVSPVAAQGLNVVSAANNPNASTLGAIIDAVISLTPAGAPNNMAGNAPGGMTIGQAMTGGNPAHTDPSSAQSVNGMDLASDQAAIAAINEANAAHAAVNGGPNSDTSSLVWALAQQNPGLAQQLADATASNGSMTQAAYDAMMRNYFGLSGPAALTIR